MFSEILSRCLWPCLDCRAMHSRALSLVCRLPSHGNQGTGWGEGDALLRGCTLTQMEHWEALTQLSCIFKYLNSFKLLNKVSKYLKNQALYCFGTCFPISKAEIILFLLGHYKEKDVNDFAGLKSNIITSMGQLVYAGAVLPGWEDRWRYY